MSEDVVSKFNSNETTNASQLENVTLDPDDSLLCAFGFHKPNVPFRGCSIKEVEEKLSNLEKENFNLKLRIYFLEERAGTTVNVDKDNAIKQNIELKVEVERLRRELLEKHDLLCKAVKAMEMEEDEFKKQLEQKENELRDIQTHFEDMQKKCQDTEEELVCRKSISMNTSDVDLKTYQDLQNKIKDLENKLHEAEREKSDKSNDYWSSMVKENQIKKLTMELEDKEKLIDEFNTRITELESELFDKENEISVKLDVIQSKDDLLIDKESEIENLKRILADVQELNEADKAKLEKHRNSLAQRNNKILEMEEFAKKQKTKIMNLETRLESAQNEVKRKNNELYAIKSPLKNQLQQNSDVNSFLVPGSTNVTKVSPKMASAKSLMQKSVTKSPRNSSTSSLTPLNKSSSASGDDDADTRNHLEAEITKLKKNELKACHIIQSMINVNKTHDKDIITLKNELKAKDNELEKMKQMVKQFQSKSGSIEKSSQKVNDGTLKPPTETENSIADATKEEEELIEKYKELANELEKHKDILMETLKEKDSQMQIIQNKHEELLKEFKLKENHIIELEFELLASGHDLSNLENKENGNEKPASFWIQEIADKDKEIERLENELRKRTCDLQGIVNNELWEKNREIEKIQKRYANIIESKDEEICHLEKDISSKDLQLTILKNKISELGVHVNLPPNLIQTLRRIHSDSSIGNPEDLETLQEELRICKEERKYFMQQMEELKQQLKNTPERDHANQVDELKIELNQIKNELDKSEKLKKESNDICLLLNERLEELAYFLDSLLNQKSVLGFLGPKQNSKLRQIIDQSLDLSKTLSMSVTLNPDQSLVQLSNISNLLNSTRNDMSIAEFLAHGDEHTSVLSILPANATLTYHSHLRIADKKPEEDSIICEQSEIIKVLRGQVENLKKEIELRDVELNKIHEKSSKICEETSTTTQVTSPKKNLTDDKKTTSTSSKTIKTCVDNQSESESWSEPDRSVSIARIGLMEETLKPPPNVNTSRRNRGLFSTESTEGEYRARGKKTPTENRQTILALHEQVCDLKCLLNEKETQLFDAEITQNEIQKLLDQERTNSQELVKQHEELIEEIKTYEDKYKILEVQKNELEIIVEDLQNTKKALEENMTEKDKETQNKINELEVEREKALATALCAEKLAEETKEDIIKAEEKLRNVYNEMNLIESKIRQEADEKISEAKQEFENEIKNIEKRTEIIIQQVTENANELRTKYENEYIKRNEVDKMKEDLIELEHFRELILQAERKIERLECSETNLKKQLQENYSKIEVLRTELDAANLHYSEAILDKTRIINEKTQCELQIQEFINKENSIMIQLEQYDEDFKAMQDNLQKQIVNIENEKSLLEVRISELESNNAELHNKLIKMQTGQGANDGPQLSLSAPTSPLKLADPNAIPLIRQLLPNNRPFPNSPWSAPEDEKVLLEKLQQLRRDKERQNSTSSPDLGIDSDHGRFSSLEANVNVSRPFLRSLEVTASMNNLLDEDRVNLTICGNEQCCAKTKEIINENSDLRRRLLRTRRALEETVTQLTLANQRKKQVEKTICKQIHKTSQVLRKAKANLDSGSESDIIFK